VERAQVLVESARAAYSRRDPLQARAKLRSSLEIRDSVTARGLWWQLAREPLLWRKSLDARVYDLDFTPDGRQLAAASQSKVVFLFDTASLATRVLQGHGDQVLRVAYSPDGRQLASAAWNGELFLWDLATGRSRTLTTSLTQSNGLLFTGDGRRLLSIGRDGAVHSFDVATGAASAPVRFGEGMTSSALARDLSAFAWIDSAGHAHLWRLPDARPWKDISREGAFTTAVALSTDGGILAWGEEDGTVRLFDIESGRELRTLTGHTARVSGLAFDRTGERLASLSWDETVRMWDVATGAGRVAPAEAGIFPNTLEFDPSGRLLASGGLVPALWRFEGAQANAASGHQSPVYGLAISPDSRWIASADIDGMVRVVDARSGVARCMFHGHEGEMRAAAFHPDGRVLATAGVDRVIKLWALPSCAPAGGLEGHERRVFDLAFSPDGRWLVSVSEDDTIRMWDFASRKIRAVLRGDPADVQRVAFSPQGDRFATIGFAGNAWLWQLDGRGERIFPGPSASGAAFSPDGSRLGLTGTDGVLRILDLTTGRWQEHRGFAGRLYDLAFYPDGKRVVVAASDKTARVLDIASGRRTALVGHDGELNAVKMDPDGAFIVTAGDDWTVRTWRTDDGRPLWFSVGFTRTGETFGHRGWATLGPARPARGAWRDAVEARARSVSSARDLLCVATWTGRLEAWDLARDARLFERAGGGRVLAGPGGCMALAAGEAHLHTSAGTRPVASGATAIAVDGSGWLVAGQSGILALARDGREVERLAGVVGATALLRVADAIVIGYQDGIVERRAAGAPVLMDDTPASPVTAISAGPAPGTMVAGFASGTLGVWDVASGMRLERMQLHGPVVHLAMDQGRLDAATDLGDQAAYDLSVFRSDYCDLLREVWRQVPTRWEEGAPRTRAPAGDHPCAR
jgi:WD40 repeat protein